LLLSLLGLVLLVVLVVLLACWYGRASSRRRALLRIHQG
jgi:hypothetical protein